MDDNKPNLNIVCAFLKDTGAKIDLCTGGNDALALCRQKRYDLILLDHMMPEPDGIQTLALLRADPTSLNRETPVVVLTANAVAGSRQMYLDAGFADYLTKPLETAAASKDLDSYRIAAHSIKSLMATVGANALRDVAKAHEDAARNGDDAFVVSGCAGFVQSFGALCSQIEAALSDPNEP